MSKMEGIDRNTSYVRSKKRESNNLISRRNMKVIVKDCPRRFVGEGIGLLDRNSMLKLKLKLNDIVKVKAKHTGFIRIMELDDSIKIQGVNPIPQFSSQKFRKNALKKPILYLDPNIQKNLYIKKGDIVEIEKIEEQIPFAKIVYFLVQKKNFEELKQRYSFIKNKLIGRVIKKGQEIWIREFFKDEGEEIHTPPSHMIDLSIVVFFHRPHPKGIPIIIGKDTILKFKPASSIDNENILQEEVYLEDVGGLKKEKTQLMEMVGVIANESDFMQKTGIKYSNAVMITGPPGCGKSLLTKAVINEFPVNYFYISGSEIASEKPSEGPEDLQNIFADAEDIAPSVIVIDEVEVLATDREDLRFDSIMRNLVSQFLHLVDQYANKPNILLIGLSNMPETIDKAFFSYTRFGKEIKILPPKKNDRVEILKIMARNINVIDYKNVDFEIIAENTYGFSGSDLNLLIQKTFFEKLKKLGYHERFIHSRLSYQILKEKIKLKTEDFMDVLEKKLVLPSILREYAIETPKITYDQVGGLKEAKKILRENIEYPIKYPELFKHYNIEGFKGLLLYGPPGCGKTLLVKALASESNMNFISIKGAEVLNHWLGESEAAVREIFAKAKESAPCIIFFDELDAIATERGVEGNVHSDRVTAQLLTELDGIEEIKNVICIGATNRIDIIDPAIMRPGRLYPVIEIPLPDAEARREIFEIYLKNKPLDKDVSLDLLVTQTEGFNGAEIEEICNQAAIIAIRHFLEKNDEKLPSIDKNNLPPIKLEDFFEAIKELKKSIHPEQSKNLYS
ncbi:MAG: AAA family ATPase [Promethearchaeota archaeon]